MSSQIRSSKRETCACSAFDYATEFITTVFRKRVRVEPEVYVHDFPKPFGCIRVVHRVVGEMVAVCLHKNTTRPSKWGLNVTSHDSLSISFLKMEPIDSSKSIGIVVFLSIS